MRKFLYILTFTTLIIISTTKVNASNEAYYINHENIEMTEQEYNNLRELGFSEGQIYRMDYQTFIDNKDIEATLLSETKQYVKTTITIRNGIKHYSSQIVSENDYLTSMQTHLEEPINSPNTSGNYYDGISMDQYQILTTMIASVDDDTMRYKLDVEWLDMPSTRSWDIIGIGIEAAKVQVASLIMFREDWITTGDYYGHTLDCLPKEENTGGSVMFELPSGSLRLLESYVYFNVTKKLNVGTLTSVVALGDYAHAITNISDENDAYDYFSMNYGGMVVYPPYTNSYIGALAAEAMFVGTW